MNAKLNKNPSQKSSALGGTPKKCLGWKAVNLRSKKSLKSPAGVGTLSPAKQQSSAGVKSKTKQDDGFCVLYMNAKYDKRLSNHWINSISSETDVSGREQSQTHNSMLNLSLVSMPASEHCPCSEGKPSTENLLSFLHWKVALLEENQKNLTQELYKQKEDADEAMDQCKILRTQRDAAVLRAQEMKKYLLELMDVVEDSNELLHGKNKVQGHLRKEKAEMGEKVKYMMEIIKAYDKSLRKAHLKIECQNYIISHLGENYENILKPLLIQWENQTKEIQKERQNRLNVTPSEIENFFRQASMESIGENNSEDNKDQKDQKSITFSK